MSQLSVNLLIYAQWRTQEFDRWGVSFPSLSLELGPLKLAMGSGEHCKLPQWGPGQSPG